MLAVVLTAAALSTAPPVPVTGGTARERAIVRAAVAALDRGMVTSARIDGDHYLVLGPSASRATGAAALRAEWEAAALVATVGRRFAAAGDRLAGYRMTGNCGHGASCGSGGSLGVGGAASTGPPGARTLRAVVLANARAAGISVRSARVLPIGGGVLSVVVRLREAQLLDRRLAPALTRLFGRAASTPGPLHFISVEAPDGTAIAYGGTYVNGGSWSYGGDSGRAPVPRGFPAALARARTDLTVVVRHGFGGLATRRAVRFVCGAGAPQQGDCRRLLADRWSLLVPEAGFACGGSPVGGWVVRITGRFAGRPVSRSYDGCYGATGLRWARFLGIAP